MIHHVCAGAGRASVAKRMLAAVGLTVGLTVGVPLAAVSADTVSQVPADWTPHLLPHPERQSIAQLKECDGTMYAVGTATAVARGSATYARSNAFSFSAATGEMTAWAPEVNGPVQSVAFSPDCGTAYLGGTFTRVNGVAADNLVAVDTTSGALRKGFGHHVDGSVTTVRYLHDRLIIGGRFTTVNGVRRIAMASVHPTTGAVTTYLHVRIRGRLGKSATEVFNSQPSHDRDRLLIEGTFLSINHHARQQAAVLTLGKKAVKVDGWTSPELLRPCVLHFFARSGAWSPDDKTIYLASTGLRPRSGRGSRPNQPRAGLCDAVSAFPAASRSVHHRWVNYSGCDSFYAVTADRRRVYAGGHQRWMNNGSACNKAGPGAVSRPGVGSIHAETGLATAWNPTHSRGHGVDQLLLTKAGLWVASDTFKNGSAQQCGGEPDHGGICFFPST